MTSEDGGAALSITITPSNVPVGQTSSSSPSAFGGNAAKAKPKKGWLTIHRALTELPEEESVGPRYEVAIIGKDAHKICARIVSSPLSKQFSELKCCKEESAALGSMGPAMSNVKSMTSMATGGSVGIAASDSYSGGSTWEPSPSPGSSPKNSQKMKKGRAPQEAHHIEMPAAPTIPEDCSPEAPPGDPAPLMPNEPSSMDESKDFVFCRLDDGILCRIRLLPVENFSDYMPHVLTRDAATNTAYIFLLRMDEDMSKEEVSTRIEELEMKKAEINACSSKVKGGIFWFVVRHQKGGNNPLCKTRVEDEDLGDQAFVQHLRYRSRSGKIEEWTDFDDGDDIFTMTARIATEMYSGQDSRLARTLSRITDKVAPSFSAGSKKKSCACVVL